MFLKGPEQTEHSVDTEVTASYFATDAVGTDTAAAFKRARRMGCT